MKKLYFVFLLVCLPLLGQNYVTANLTAASADCSLGSACASLSLDKNSASSVVAISGTWVGTVQFEASNDGGNTWSAINATPPNSTTAVTSSTGTGTWRINVSAMTNVRVRCSAYTSGTIVVKLSVGNGSASTGNGGGTPGGSNAQIQYNNSGAFGGAANTSLDSSGNAVFNTVGTGTAPTACGTATGCFGATGASTEGSQVAGQGYLRLDTNYWKVRHVNGTSTFFLGSNYSATGTGAIGALDSTNGVSQTIVCTATCSLTPLSPPAAGYQLCVVMAAGVTGTITLNALGNSAMYGKTDGSAYGTAGTGTAVSGSATGNRICIVGRDSTHYEVTGSNGTFTMN